MSVQPRDLVDKHPNDIAENLEQMELEQQAIAFLLLPGNLKGEVFAYLDQPTQENILRSLGSEQIAEVLQNMPPDDRTQVFANFPDTLIKEAVNLLSERERKIALSLIGYEENSVGRMMTPYYIQVKRHWTIEQTLRHIKRVGKKAETLNFIYVVDDDFRLIDDIRIGSILMAEEDKKIESLLDYQYVSLNSTQNKEDAVIVFEKYDRAALPVVSENGVLVGIVTFDDILDVMEQRDTEDIQKFGGLEALDLPYTQTGLLDMVKKRAGWLIILFISEMLTASAMGYFEAEIEKAVVLALFIPLIISSGGNSGSQAATLIIRAMALKELALRDWWYVMRREVASGVLLGSVLGLIGFLRILVWQETGFYDYGVHWFFVALSVAVSLLFIVLWGTLSGSMIPFLLKGLKLDPATSSAPFVATLVDVTGVIIYFSIAAFFLSGRLL
ncbi:magnesium transporter [Paraflavisolibacter sp. H34]|uniref:magnesium transporter n=1 Tax=Huijunlia imazamoxiresistens TaxID=3127457 RepID=UPI003018E9E9